MKRIVLAALGTVLSLSLVATDVQAKRLSSGGMQRSVPTQPQRQSPPPAAAPQQTPTPPAQQAAPQQVGGAAAAAPAAAPKRSWMGPLAGVAAGLGLAALASHLGFGAGLANFMSLLLIGLLAFVVIGFVMRRLAANKAPASQGLQFAGAPAGGGGISPQEQATHLSPGTAMPASLAAAPADTAAPQFDTAGFEQIAKRVFIRLQAANDKRDQADLRRFTTPEMYAVVQQELLDRKGEQQTDVLQLNAQVIERAEEQDQQIVSVRFSGLIREQSETAAQPFDEVWHLVRPLDGSRDWAIAGIQALA